MLAPCDVCGRRAGVVPWEMQGFVVAFTCFPCARGDRTISEEE